MKEAPQLLLFLRNLVSIKLYTWESGQEAPSLISSTLFLVLGLFCFVLFCFVLFCFVLFCFVLFCFVLFCFVLFCFVLFCFVLLR